VGDLPANTQTTRNNQLLGHTIKAHWAVSHNPESQMEASTHEEDGRESTLPVTGSNDLVSNAMRRHPLNIGPQVPSMQKQKPTTTL